MKKSTKLILVLVIALAMILGIEVFLRQIMGVVYFLGDLALIAVAVYFLFKLVKWVNS